MSLCSLKPPSEPGPSAGVWWLAGRREELFSSAYQLLSRGAPLLFQWPQTLCHSSPPLADVVLGLPVLQICCPADGRPNSLVPWDNAAPGAATSLCLCSWWGSCWPISPASGQTTLQHSTWAMGSGHQGFGLIYNKTSQTSKDGSSRAFLGYLFHWIFCPHGEKTFLLSSSPLLGIQL